VVGIGRGEGSPPGSRAQVKASCDRLIRSAASDSAAVLHRTGVDSHHHVHVFQQIAAPGRERPLWFGVLRGHFNQDRICRNVIDLDETPIKIIITDPVINADNAIARDLAAQLPRGVPV